MEAEIASLKSALFEAQNKLAEAQNCWEIDKRDIKTLRDELGKAKGALRKAKDILEKLNTDDRQQPWVEAALAAATALLEDK